MLSQQSYFYNRFLELTNPKRFLRFDKPLRFQREFVPLVYRLMRDTEIKKINEKTVATLNNTNDEPQTHVIYLHGGGYTLECTPMHWVVARRIIKQLNCRISMIDYPLAPEHYFKETYKMLRSSYDYLLERFPFDNFVLMGDSAGGGLALAFLQELIEQSYPTLPQKSVLFSPWLDLSMTNPEIEDLEQHENLLSVKSLLAAAKYYARGFSLTNPELSPIFGPLDGLGKIGVFYGTKEIFLPDCRKLKQLSVKCNSEFTFFEYKDMTHDWILSTVLPEANKAIDEACTFIKAD